MIVARIAVRMVKVSMDQIVDVSAMRHWFVSATWAVYVIRIMSPVGVLRTAARRAGVADLQHVLFDLAVRADIMQMTV